MKTIRNISRRLWRDQTASTSAIGLILVTLIVAIGGIVGLATIRDQVVQEMGDIGVALNNLDQSFSYTITIDTDGDGAPDETLTASYDDDDIGRICGNMAPDDPNFVDEEGEAPAGLSFASP